MQNTILDKLSNLLGKSKILSGEDLKQRYHHIWHMDKPLRAKAIALPSTTQEVSMVLKTCHAQDQSVIVYGGLTN